MAKKADTHRLVQVLQAVHAAKKEIPEGKTLARVLLTRPQFRVAQDLFTSRDQVWRALQGKINKLKGSDTDTRLWHVDLAMCNTVMRLALTRLRDMGALQVRPDGQVGVLLKG